eukprot:6843350-Pyramimonas_sp.AAC.1
MRKRERIIQHCASRRAEQLMSTTYCGILPGGGHGDVREPGLQALRDGDVEVALVQVSLEGGKALRSK